MPYIPVSRRLTSRSIEFPNRCSRCLSEKPSDIWRVTGGHGSYYILFKTRSTYSINVPVCRNCWRVLTENNSRVNGDKRAAAVVTWLISGVVLSVLVLSSRTDFNVWSTISGVLVMNILAGGLLAWVAAKLVASNYKYDTTVAEFVNRGKGLEFFNEDYQDLYDKLRRRM